MQSVLNVNITMFERANKPDSYRTVNLLTVLQSDKYKPLADTCSQITDKKERQLFKLHNVPVITVSGTFEGGRKESNLLHHSGLVCLDLDGVQDIDTLKSNVCKLPFMAYCGLSISGTGLFAIVHIPESTPEAHKQSYAALENYFVRHFGITGTVDPQPKNVAACRYVSYDPQGHFNHKAEIFTDIREDNNISNLFVKRSLERNKKMTFSDYDKVWDMVDKIRDNHLDFCPNYADYLRVAFSLAAGLGESGRDAFHAVCQYSTAYSFKDTEKKYSEALKHGNKVTLGTFFSMCKDYGLIPETQTIQIPIYSPKRKAVPTKLYRWKLLNRLLNKGNNYCILLNEGKIIKSEWDNRCDNIMRQLKAAGIELEEYKRAANFHL